MKKEQSATPGSSEQKIAFRGEVTQIGNDANGHPRIIIHGTREDIRSAEVLLFNGTTNFYAERQTGSFLIALHNGEAWAQDIAESLVGRDAGGSRRPMACVECGDGIMAHDSGVCGNCYATKYRDAPAVPVSAPDVPNIGEKWPGTEAIYAGISPSISDDGSVHLLLWPDKSGKGLSYDKAVEFAESVNPAMLSHIPTRHQSITLFERLRDQFDQDYWHWTLTKTKSGKAAFYQGFLDGYQSYHYLSAECRVRAVSEIPL